MIRSMLQKNNTEKRIVEAAVQLFARRGFNGTRTQDVARLANVSEASIFRYFTRKQDLFWAAVQSRVDRLSIGRELSQALARNAAPEAVLPLVVEMLVQTVNDQPELIPLLCFANIEMRRGTERMCRHRLGPIWGAIANYLEGAISAGRVRSTNAAFATTAFISSVLADQILLTLLTGTAAKYKDTGDATAAYSRFWMELLTPGNGSGKPSTAVTS